MLWNKLKIGVMILLAAVAFAGAGGVGYRVVAGAGSDESAAQAPGKKSPQAADAPVKDKAPVVREIDMQDYKGELPKGRSVYQCSVLTSIEDLAKVIPNKEWLKRIAKQVDFDNERLLSFAWAGSSGDQLTYRVTDGKAGPVVVFTYTPGKTSEDVTQAHFRLYALSKDVGWRVEDADKQPASEAPAAPAREIDIRGDAIKPPVVNILKPTEITNGKVLGQVAGSDKVWFDKINNQVDFEKERLLLFAWNGSSGDKFWFTIGEPKGARLVTFHRWHGEEGDENQHVRLFAVDKTANLAFKEENNPPPEKAAALVVKEIAIHGAKPKALDGPVHQPLLMANVKDLEKVFPLEEWRAKIGKQVDFSKERLLFFHWSGAPHDTLESSVEEGKEGPVVAFRYEGGSEATYTVYHVHLFAIPKDVSWHVESAKPDSPPAKPPAPNKDTPTTALLKLLDSDNLFHRAAAIDLLGDRKAKEAIPRLVELLDDRTALLGSDNYVSLHAQNALRNITGESFGEEVKKWKEWLKTHPQEAAKSPESAATEGSVKVLSAEATVELRGILVHTPKGDFVVVRDAEATAATTWELDCAKAPGLAEQAKQMSGKKVVATGTCKMVRADLNQVYGGAYGEKWEMQKVVAVTKLSAAETK